MGSRLPFAWLPRPLGEGRGEGRPTWRQHPSSAFGALTLTLSQRERESCGAIRC